jgi:hypothetical protein
MSAIDVNPNRTDSEVQRAPSPPRVRLVSVAVQLSLVADDGVNLDPIPVQPIQVRAVDWPMFNLDEQIADVQRQLGEQVLR